MIADKTKAHDENKTLLEQGRRIRALHNIISRPDLSFDQQIDETLRLGCELLGTEIGKIGRQDPENNISEFLNVVVMTDLPVKRGTILPLDKTFCQVTFSAPEAIAISHVSESEYKDHPAASYIGMESYIGTSINVYGKKFGTINFSNRSPVVRQFTEADKDLVNLMGSWISVMMERQQEAEELKKSKQAADTANQAKSSFLANMSHEIRTPLTSIIGYAELALDENQTREQHLTALGTIFKSGSHLLNLINDILDFSKIEADELDLEQQEVDPLQLVSEIQSMMTQQASKKAIEFTVSHHFPLPARISTDPLRLKQILLNLCGNAVKFTEKGSVTLNLEYHEPDDSIIFTVRDTGIGMTEDQLDKLYKAFKQADSSISRRFGGSGLGMFLSKRLVEMLGGDMEVSSQYGVGTEFRLRLPNVGSAVNNFHLLQSIEDHKPEGSANEEYVKLSGNVLVAEDNEVNQQLIRAYIESLGLTVTMAGNGAEAIEMANKSHFDLIYMDMQMPVMSGIDAVKQLRDDGCITPIVMLTANATANDRRQCAEAGSNDYLTKPINRSKLYAVSKKFLG